MDMEMEMEGMRRGCPGRSVGKTEKPALRRNRLSVGCLRMEVCLSPWHPASQLSLHVQTDIERVSRRRMYITRERQQCISRCSA